MEDKVEYTVVDETTQFVMIQAELLKDLGQADFYIYSILKYHAGNKGKNWFSLNTLSKQYKISRPTIIKAISSLIDKRIIAKEGPKRERVSNTYYILK